MVAKNQYRIIQKEVSVQESINKSGLFMFERSADFYLTIVQGKCIPQYLHRQIGRHRPIEYPTRFLDYLPWVVLQDSVYPKTPHDKNSSETMY